LAFLQEKTMDKEFPAVELRDLGFFERRKLKSFYKNFIGNSDFVITIGDVFSNITEIALNIGAMVLVVEPLPENFKVLQERLAKFPNSMLLHKDIGAFTAEFSYNQAYERNILPYSSNLTVSENQALVKITTVDELIREYGVPTFLKINANGFENEVLKGLSHKLFVISFSFYSYLHEKTIENIRRLIILGDYEFNWILDENPKFESKTWLSARELHTSMSEFSKERFSGEIFARLKTIEG
jgi:FkbM family methyltransferase